MGRPFNPYPLRFGQNYSLIGPDCCSGDPQAIAQAAWFIDPQNVSGNASDANSGADAAHPIVSWAELRSRIGPRPTYYHNVTFTYLSAWPTTDRPVTSFDVAAGFTATIVGTVTLGAAFNLTAFATFNPATPEFDLATAATVWVPGTWFEVLDGPNAGNGFFAVAASPAPGTARVYEPFNDVTQNVFAPTNVQQIAQATFLSVPDLIEDHSGAGQVIIKRFSFNEAHFAQIAATTVFTCDFTAGLFATQPFFCWGSVTRVFDASAPYVVIDRFAGGWLDSVILAGTAALGTLRQNSPITTDTASSTQTFQFYGAIGGDAVFDTANPTRIRKLCTYFTVANVYGSGNTGTGIDISGAQYVRFVNCTYNLPGLAIDFSVDALVQLFPYDPVTGLPAAAPIATTFANLVAPFPAGFGGSAWNSVSPFSGVFKETL